VRIALAVALLVVIGAIEALASADELAAAGRRPSIGGVGLVVGALGLVASVAIYAVLGRSASTVRAAVRTGAVTGALAGGLGAVLRALILLDTVASAVSRYAIVPTWFVPAYLVSFVIVALIVSAVAGAVIAWLAFRLTRTRSPRPPA